MPMKIPQFLAVTTAVLGTIGFIASDAVAGQGPEPTICTRACWTARAPKCSISQMGALTRAIIHHTASTSDFNTTSQSTSISKVRATQNYHMDTAGYCDIAYHFLVDKLGYIFEGRSGSMNTASRPRGSHDGNNTDSFGFNIMGYYHPGPNGEMSAPYNNIPTATSLDKLYDVIAWRMPSAWSPYGSGTYNGVNVGYLDSHRKVKSTACPGNNIHDVYITDNRSGGDARNGVNMRKNGGGGVGGGSGGNRVGIARSANGGGYWIVASDGGVFSFGGAPFYGSMGGQPLNSPVVGMAARPQGDGYWLVAADGGIFSFGAAPFHGSMGGQPLNQPVVAITSTASGNGYWMVAKDGGIFSFGDAPYHGSWGGQGLTDFVGMAANPSNGYWLVRATGSIYTFGPAGYYGGGEAGSGVRGIAAKSDGTGYWQVRDNGNIYSYNATYANGANELTFVGIARGPNDSGYWIMKSDGAVFSFGAPYYGGANY